MAQLKIVVIAAIASLALAACDHTIRGAGQDIRDTGNAVESAAQQ